MHTYARAHTHIFIFRVSSAIKNVRNPEALLNIKNLNYIKNDIK